MTTSSSKRASPRRSKIFPLLRLVEWLGANRVRLFFSTGRVTENRLPVKSARRAKIVDLGMGLDPGDGLDMSADGLYERGKIVCEGRRGIPLRQKA